MHHIVIGTDLTDEGRSSFQAGLALAKDIGASVVLVHALPVESTSLGLAGNPAPGETPESRERDAIAHARRLSEEWLAVARADGVEAKGRVEPADAATLILESSPDARMIVVGSHQRSGAARFFLGSVSQEVLRRAKCPVLVVPNPRD